MVAALKIRRWQSAELRYNSAAMRFECAPLSHDIGGMLPFARTAVDDG